MTKPIVDKQKLKFLRSQLEHGDIQQIADQLKLSRSTVSKSFKGEIRNLKVLEKAMALIKDREKLIKAINSTI